MRESPFFYCIGVAMCVHRVRPVVMILYSWTNVRAEANHLYTQEPHLRTEGRDGRRILS